MKKKMRMKKKKKTMRNNKNVTIFNLNIKEYAQVGLKLRLLREGLHSYNGDSNH